MTRTPVRLASYLSAVVWFGLWYAPVVSAQRREGEDEAPRHEAERAASPLGVAAADADDEGGKELAKRNYRKDTRKYVPGGDPNIPHPGVVPNMNPTLETPPPEFAWQQILANQRISGQFNTIEVDANNPDRVFVGTYEATIVRTDDGGVTWRELELLPFTISARQVQVPTRPSLNGGVSESYDGTLQPPGALPLFENARLGLDSNYSLAIFPDDVSEVVFYDGAPARNGIFPPNNVDGAGVTFGDAEASYVDVFYRSGGLERRDTLLTRAVRGRAFETSPVRMIAICPGNDFSVFAATYDELFGSTDEGITWVRLMRIPGMVRMHRVRCSRRNPKRMLVGTDFGLFYSTDGGNSFDPELTARPGEPAYAVNFGNVDETGNEIALVALDVRLFRGHPDSQAGLDWAYPNFDNPETAPWARITSITATPDGQIWLATRDGLRVSRDNGVNWEIVAPWLFNAHPVQQVLASGNEHGGLRIAVFVEDCPEPPLKRFPTTSTMVRCRNSFIYATDDGGKSWFPWFVGVSRRRPVWMAATPYVEGEPGRWFIATGGGVWATHSGFDAQRGAPDVDEESQRWATKQLRINPSLYDVKEISFDHFKLSRDALENMWYRARYSGAFLPDIRVLANYNRGTSHVVRDQDGDVIKVADERTTDAFWDVAVQARWFTFDMLAYFAFGIDAPGEDNETRGELYELRRQIDFIVEDVWHERVMLLRRLRDGMRDDYQISVIRERIELLELTLEFWMGQPLPSVKRRFLKEEQP